MGRVNVEESFFGERRLAKLQAMMGWSRQHTAGALLFLWHGSQEMIRVNGTAAEIIDWAWIDDPVEGEKFVAAAVACTYLRRTGPNDFLISGNETQLENMIRFSNRASKGGKAKHLKWLAAQQTAQEASASSSEGSASSILEAKHKHASSTPELCLEHTSSMHNAGQGNAGQGRAVCGEAPTDEVRPPGIRSLEAVWNEERRGKMAECVEIKPGTKRAAAAKARLAEEPDLEAWRSVLRRATANPFVRGEIPGREGRPPFRADIDWLLRPNTRIEILEGKYDTKRAAESERRGLPLITGAD